MKKYEVSNCGLYVLLTIATFIMIIALAPGYLITNARAEDQQTKQIQVHSWGGAPQEALEQYAFQPFTNETGVKVVSGNFTGMDQYIAQVKASFPQGGEFNIGHMSSLANYIKFLRLGYDVVLDESKIPNLKNVMPAILEPMRKLNKGKISAVPYDYGQTGIVYNPKYVSKEKAERLGVALLWDKDLKGKIGGSFDWRPSIWYAALYTRQNPNDIKDIGAVWQALREQQKLVKKYWTSGSEFNHLFASEEIYAAIAFSGRAYALKLSGVPIEWLKVPNTFSWMEYMFVLKGTDLDIAYKLLNYMLEPKPSIEVAIAQNYPPALDPTKVKMPEYVQNMTAFDPSGKLHGYLFAEPYYWSTYYKEWAEMWDRIQAGY